MSLKKLSVLYCVVLHCNTNCFTANFTFLNKFSIIRIDQLQFTHAHTRTHTQVTHTPLDGIAYQPRSTRSNFSGTQISYSCILSDVVEHQLWLLYLQHKRIHITYVLVYCYIIWENVKLSVLLLIKSPKV